MVQKLLVNKGFKGRLERAVIKVFMKVYILNYLIVMTGHARTVYFYYPIEKLIVRF